MFSAGKDHMVKCWDGDKFEQVMTLPVRPCVCHDVRCASIGYRVIKLRCGV